MYEKVTDTPFFSGIEIFDEPFISKQFNHKKLAANEILWHQGEPAASMCIIQHGQFTKSFDTESRSVVLSYHKAGDIMGEAEVMHSLRRRYVTTKAITDASLWLIQRKNLDELLSRHSQIYQRLFDAIGSRFIRAGRKINYLSFMDAHGRVSQLLVDYITDTQHLERVPDWNVTQQEIAHMVGLNRESVARVLSDLQTQGAILNRRGRINLISPAKLRQIASQSNRELINQPFFQGKITTEERELL
ncbi:MAG: Crp/Fnr family transcriptional regulator [Alicyclobacillaceae bacterium]|jgi:CRP-like cAMP-binding protein|nr:Crp/Fnr family transcriptional regulator [Alicyclobacillaceae bacterium]